MRTWLKNFFKGIFVGVANVIPGVSGGTIMVVLGIFDEVIDAVNSFYKNIELFKKHFLYLLPLAIGCLVGILGFGSMIDSALISYSFPTVLFFAGLVIGSLPLIYKKAAEKNFSSKYYIATAISALIVIMISLMSNRNDVVETEIITAAVMLKFLICGAISAAAMVIPGISGSFIMLLFGLYYDLLHTISKISEYLANPFNFELLADIMKIAVPLMIGIIAGILIVSKIISILLDKFTSLTYCVILGLIIGSLFGLFNDPITYQSGVNVVSVIAGIATLTLGSVIALILGGK